MSAIEARKLKEIREYADLLTAKDNALVVASAISAIVSDAIAGGATPAAAAEAASAAIAMGGINVVVNGNIYNRDFNVYLGKYITKNIATIAPDVIAYMDSELAANLAEANAEAADLGLTSTPPVPTPAPAFSPTSDGVTVAADSAFSYNIASKASNLSGWDITYHTFADAGLSASTPAATVPTWATLDASTGMLTGTVPTTVVSGTSETVKISVTTDNGTAPTPFTLTITYA